MIQLIPRFSIN